MDLENSKQSVAEKLLNWFTRHQRPLPWRRDYQPYHVWISEIMGQQTQMDRVVLYFNNWISLFPDITSLAAASEQQVFKAWEGLGYYSRARNIQKTAQLLVDEYNSDIPENYQTLLALPGIGPYTAAAISSIAFNQPVPLLDANVKRVLCRLADIARPVKQRETRQLLQQLSQLLLAENNPRDFNQAMMELGALVCTPKKPACPACPIQHYCRALAADTVQLRPVPKKKEKKIEIVMACGIVQHNNRLFIQQRLADDVWGGLWEFPGGRLKQGETPEQAAVRELAEETEFVITRLRPFATVVHFYTKYRVTLHSFFCQLKDGQSPEPILHAASQYKWVKLEELNSFAFPSGHRKLIKKMVVDKRAHPV
jgi:A/G-specific adenine glycosylase